MRNIQDSSTLFLDIKLDNGDIVEVEVQVWSELEPADPQVGILSDSWEPLEYEPVAYMMETENSWTEWGGHDPHLEEKIKQKLDRWWETSEDEIWREVNNL